VTQADQILQHLRSGKHITPLEALNRFGCFRLGARIYDLKEAGHAIESRMVTLASGKKVASYHLASGAHATS
jgi:helix-turn-helix protein